jgi:outer membrane protein TolC
LLLPADLPTEEPIQFDPDEAIKTALDYRADLSQQRLKIDSAYVTQKAAQNNELPTLNTTVSFGVQGDGANIGQMFRSTGDGNLLDYTLGFELDIPLGFQEARAIFRRTQLTRYQEIGHYQELEAKAAQEVKDAIYDITARWQQIDLARQARLKSQHVLSLLEDKIQNKGLALSPAITQTRLQYQMDFANSQQSEIEAIANYNIALSKLELAKGTLLRYNNVTMAEELPNSLLPEEMGKEMRK